MRISSSEAGEAAGVTEAETGITATDTGATGTPFADAVRITPAEPGVYRAELDPRWTVVSGRLHGGVMLALATRAGLVGLRDHLGAQHLADPVAVSADFLHAPLVGPVELRTQVVKQGRTVSVVRVELNQRGRTQLSAAVTASRLPDEPVRWADLPDLPAEPPADAVRMADLPDPVPFASACDVWLDPESAGWLRAAPAESAEPVIRGWVRPKNEEPSALFTLVAGDILPPTVLKLGRPGWAPTVQLTALLRARPAPGWLRLRTASTTVAGGWFDEDCTVIDSAGRLVCQARQLALTPLVQRAESA